MAKLTIPNIFTDGQTISASELDANFAAVATLVNTTKLGADNFRPFGGITNDRKAEPYSPTPLTAVIPELHVDASGSVNWPGIIAIPHYNQYSTVNDQDDGNGNVTKVHPSGFKIDYLEAVWHGATVGGSASALPAGDTFDVKLKYRKRHDDSLTTVTLDASTADNTLVESAVGATAADYLQVELDYTADATVGERIVYNLVVTVWVKFLHVGG